MRRHVALLVAAVVVGAPSLAGAQETLPALPPPPPPPMSAPPAAPPPVQGQAQVQGEVTYDGTAAPPSTTTVPAPYAPPPPTYPEPPLGPCGGPGAFTHDGFYMRISSGTGFFGMGGSGPGNADTKLSGVGSSGRFALGGTPARGLVIGGSFAGVGASDMNLSGFPAGLPGHGWNGAAGTISAFIDWFPDVHRGWHVGGALGVGGVVVTNPTLQTTWSGAGGAGQVFGGYDFWIGSEWALGLQGNLGATSRADMKDGDQNSVGYQLGSVVFALEATLLYH